MKYTKALKKEFNFRRIFKKGKYFKSNNITLYVMKNNYNMNYLGICVSKKNGNSVIRNKLKRWVKESYKNMEEQIQQGNNIIILFKKDINGKDLNFTILYNEIKYLLKEAKIINE